MARHTLLTQIRDLTLAIRDILPAPSVRHSEVPSKLDILPLSLESPGPESLSAEFSTNTAGPELHRLVTSLFEDKVAQLQQIYQEAFRRAVVALQECDQLDEAYHQSFRNLLARRYSLQIEEIWQSILQALSTIHWRRTVALDVSSSFQAALCDQGDAAYASKGSRGHDSNAVQILERAFCHTPNISQAEKYRLAEVTGLKPKQVTIWFQNRRNRKGKKGFKHERTTSPPTFAPPLPNPHTRYSTSTVDSEHSEKKRKSYGALDRCSPENTDSDSDSRASHVKKPRIPRFTSGTSKASASSEEYKPTFPGWSSPSSHSASSSSASSGPSDCFGREQNVFRLLNPLKYEGRANQCMPPVTIASPAPSMRPRMGQDELSPFTIDKFSGAGLEAPQNSFCLSENGMIGLDFGNLEQDLGALQRELKDSIQKVLELSPLTSATSRNSSSSSWDLQQVAMDDDGWVDEDELGAAPAKPSESLVNGTAALTFPSSQPSDAAQPADADLTFSQATTDAWNTTQLPSAGGDTSVASSHSYFCEDDCFDLNQFFESAASTINAGMVRANSPFLLHQQQSPPQQHHSTTKTATEAGVDSTPTCLDFEVEMADIQDYLNKPPFVAPNPDTASGGERMEEASEGVGAHFYLNFDLSSDVFYLS